MVRLTGQPTQQKPPEKSDTRENKRIYKANANVSAEETREKRETWVTDDRPTSDKRADDI